MCFDRYGCRYTAGSKLKRVYKSAHSIFYMKTFIDLMLMGGVRNSVGKKKPQKITEIGKTSSATEEIFFEKRFQREENKMIRW